MIQKQQRSQPEDNNRHDSEPSADTIQDESEHAQERLTDARQDNNRLEANKSMNIWFWIVAVLQRQTGLDNSDRTARRKWGKASWIL